jgi:putative transposase
MAGALYCRKLSISREWRIEETYIKVRSDWMYLYCAVNSHGCTVEFWFSERRDLVASKRLLNKAFKRYVRPERIVIHGSQTNREAVLSCDTTDRLWGRSRRKPKPIRICQSRFPNNRIEQDHRAVKHRGQPMIGFEALNSARTVLAGIEMVHMMR